MRYVLLIAIAWGVWHPRTQVVVSTPPPVMIPAPRGTDLSHVRGPFGQPFHLEPCTCNNPCGDCTGDGDSYIVVDRGWGR